MVIEYQVKCGLPVESFIFCPNFNNQKACLMTETRRTSILQILEISLIKLQKLVHISLDSTKST